MSKKNKLVTRRNAHALDLQREREAKEQKEKLKQRKEAKLVVKGVEKKIKKKGVRLRKGVMIKGIKVTDSETKRKAVRALKKEAAAKLMEADEGPGGQAVAPVRIVKTSSTLAKIKGRKKRRVAIAREQLDRLKAQAKDAAMDDAGPSDAGAAAAAATTAGAPAAATPAKKGGKKGARGKAAGSDAMATD